MQALLNLVQRHKTGHAVGIYSICSAHPVVLRSALQEALPSDSPLLIEATSNQVNQDGGYTGMTPQQFQHYVMALADEVGFPRHRVLLGGDHLGPNCWQANPSEVAMAKAEVMVAQYVEAGFRKIHLDCSMSCADDPVPLPEFLVAMRAARLCAAAEDAHRRVGGEPPVYVIGTEVPVPGGAHEDLSELAVTRPEAAAHTLATHQEAFALRGLAHVWPRVIGLVVQPGVEFDHHKVIDYQPDKARALSAFIDAHPGLVYEAHSTDYQTPGALKALVRDHFAILKVGPGATFGLRETLWALADIERECIGQHQASGFKQTVLGAMQAQPQHWQKYYQDPDSLPLDLQFSLSDRIRYYWALPDVQTACSHMLANLSQHALPLTLISQYLPQQHTAIREGRLSKTVPALLHEGVGQVLRPYMAATLASAPLNAAVHGVQS